MADQELRELLRRVKDDDSALYPARQRLARIGEFFEASTFDLLTRSMIDLATNQGLNWKEVERNLTTLGWFHRNYFYSPSKDRALSEWKRGVDASNPLHKKSFICFLAFDLADKLVISLGVVDPKHVSTHKGLFRNTSAPCCAWDEIPKWGESISQVADITNEFMATAGSHKILTSRNVFKSWLRKNVEALNL